MADPPSFFVTSLAGQNIPIVPDEFLSGKNEFMKLKLTSDAFDRTWEVKLNGRRFAGGWKDFSAAHCLRDDDVLIFSHDGDMFFHVTPSGRSFSLKKQQCASSFEEEDDDDDEEDSEDDDDDDDDEEDSEDDDDDDGDEDDSEEDDDDVGDKEEDETWEDDSDSMNKKKSRLKAESSSSSENSFFLAVTPSSLRKNQVTVSRPFSRSNGLNKRYCEIDLMNESGKSWVVGLRHNKASGQDYIFGDWRSFCRANELKSGFSYRFNLVRNATRPLLQLCSDIAPVRNCSKPNARANVSAKSSSEEMKNFLTVTFKPYMLKSRQLRIPRHFARENGIKEGEIITLVDQNGKKWQSYLASAREQSNFYMTKSWIRFCAANRLKIGETFTLKFVRGEDTTPMLKFCSNAKVEMEQVPLDEEEDCQEETETRVQKRARVSTEGGPSRCTRASNKSSVDPKNLQCKQPLQPCSLSDQLTKVKQSIVDTLTGVRRFRSELEIKEQNLEASLQAIDALGEKVLEINKILK